MPGYGGGGLVVNYEWMYSTGVLGVRFSEHSQGKVARSIFLLCAACIR